MNNEYSDAVRTTFRSASDKVSGGKISDAQLNTIVQYLTSPGSGATQRDSVADLAESGYSKHQAKLDPGKIYLGYGGTDRNGTENWLNASDFKRSHGNAGMISDTPWGKHVEALGNDPDIKIAAAKLDRFLSSEGIIPAYGATATDAIKDTFWCYGSAPYIQNGIESKLPMVGFVDGAPLDRGYTSHELPRLIASPEAVFNGYKMSSVRGDPVVFTADSAANFQTLHADAITAASRNSGRTISMAEFGRHVDIAYGFDAEKNQLFGLNRDDFFRLNIDEMATHSDGWSRARATSEGTPHYRTPVERRQQLATGQQRAPALTDASSGPLRLEPEAAGFRSTSHSLISGAEFTSAASAHAPNIGSRAFAVAGEVGLAGEALHTLKRANDLSATGNTIGTQSEVIHFGSRNLSAWGGAVLGAEAGAALGIESGPGAFVTATIGGIAGTVGGDKIAAAVDDYRTYHQADRDGHTWRMDPEEPEQGWTRQVSGGPAQGIGRGPHAMPTQTLTAGPELASELNYKASGVQVQLQLANPSLPRDPYTQKADAMDTPSLREASWRRDPETHQWNRQVTDGYLEHGLPRSHQEQASPGRASRLDQAAQATMAENKAIQPHAIAGRYLEAHHQFGWDRFGPPEPSAVHAANAPRNVQQASDGNEYIRGRDGQWTHEGMFGRQTQARGNLRDELDAGAPAQAPHRHGLKQGLNPSLMHGETLPPAAQRPSEQRGELGDRLSRMLEAAHQGDWNSFRQDTQAFANMQPGQQLQADAIAMADSIEELNAQVAMQAELRAQAEPQVQQQQQQQGPVHGMSR